MTNGQKPPVVPPIVRPPPPPPVVPFRKQLEEWEKKAEEQLGKVKSSQVRLEELSKVLEPPREPVTPIEKLYKVAKPFILDWGPLFPSTVKEGLLREQTKAEITEVSNQLERADFYYRLYNEVPYVIAGGKSVTVDDILSNLTMPANLTTEEIAEITDTLSDMISTITIGEPAIPEMAAEVELQNYLS